MELSSFLEARGHTDAQFAELIGVDRSSVSRMRRGLHVPTREVMKRIVEATHGEVTPNDFFGIKLPARSKAAGRRAA